MTFVVLLSGFLASAFYPMSGIIFGTAVLAFTAVCVVPVISDHFKVLPRLRSGLLPKPVAGLNAIIRAVVGLKADEPMAFILKACFAVFMALLTFVTAVQGLRSSWADQESDDLMSQSVTALNNGDVEGAEEGLQRAVDLDAHSSIDASDLLNRIKMSRDPATVRRALLRVSDREFEAFAQRGQLPASLDRGYTALNRMEAASVRTTIESIRTDRAAIASKRAADAAEAQRVAAVEAAAAQAKANKEAAEQLAKETRNTRETNDVIAKFMAEINGDDISRRLVDHITVERDQRVWTATITVTNLWHIRPKQIRLQDAQTLQQCWRSVTFSLEEDTARINIVDFNGNAVGGSRWYAGSRIWVQD